MIKSKTTPIIKNWTPLLRNRVGDSVIHNNATWSNRTGGNSEPSDASLDWQKIIGSDAQQKTSTSFEINVGADSTSFLIPNTSSITILEVDLYVDQIRIIDSEFTLTNNTIDFGSETVHDGSIIHGRIYYNQN